MAFVEHIINKDALDVWFGEEQPNKIGSHSVDVRGGAGLEEDYGKLTEVLQNIEGKFDRALRLAEQSISATTVYQQLDVVLDGMELLFKRI